MSRIGKKPIGIPAKVTVAVADGSVKIDGPNGSLSAPVRSNISVEVDDGAKTVTVSLDEASMGDRFSRAMWGTTRATIQNMITGVTAGFQKIVEVNGVGYGAEVQGNKLKVTAGYANPHMKVIPDGVKVDVEKGSVTKVVVKGPDKQKVGQFAAEVRSVRTTNPYTGKGISYSGERIRRKQGKKFGA
ncbi:MAG: 50S ribosomal protein L6 [Phycisphaeraceae bacterium]|nr:50S ribosomal protein L6 [Phycisphaerales bacterium]MCB9860289.1 50S ribosomal protein L6 [Phycisphaeraceae bacterium]